MECPICFNVYGITERYAVRLECFHVMCVICLNSLSKQRVLKCPVCFTSYKDIDDISKCQTITNMLIALENQEIPKPEVSEEVSFIVRNFKGNLIDLKLNRNQRVSNIKTILSKIEGLSENSQWLLFKGRALRDDATIADCEIDSGSMVYLVVRTFGG